MSTQVDTSMPDEMYAELRKPSDYLATIRNKPAPLVKSTPPPGESMARMIPPDDFAALLAAERTLADAVYAHTRDAHHEFSIEQATTALETAYNDAPSAIAAISLIIDKPKLDAAKIATGYLFTCRNACRTEPLEMPRKEETHERPLPTKG